MPRHPPCALRSLSHKPSTKTTTPPATPSPTMTVNAESTATQHTKDQTTHTTTPHPQQAEDSKHAHLFVCSTKLLRKHPTHPHAQPRPTNERRQHTRDVCEMLQMLASTLQQPNTTPTNTTHPTTRPDRQQREPKEPRDSSGPNSVPTPIPHQPARFHTHPRGPHNRDTQNKQY